MNKIKFAGLGWEGPTGQITRIREGIQELGHEINNDNPDLIYCNDPGQYLNGIKLKKRFSKAILFFNFLDVPWHFPGVMKKLTIESTLMREHADIVSVISNKVKKDLSKFYNKQIEVIYNPAKDISLNKSINKTNNFLYVGRANDPIKRVKLIYEAFKNDSEIKNIIFCGPQDPGFGNYLGIVEDKKLNELYNSSKFVLLPSKAEGIGLSMIEGMICGSVPLMCSDNLTAKEFAPKEFFCEPDPKSIKNKIEEVEKEYKDYREMALKYGKLYKIKFNKKTIANNILEIYRKKIKKNSY
tara:strand:- start:414 stop:1307 length:894 start_codon:yes stop_codon:yes gene_type:complete